MRKGMIVLLAVLLSVSFVSMVFAQEGRDAKAEFMQKLAAAKSVSFSGEVLSHDVACHCVVVKTAKGNLTIQDDYAKFMQEYNQAKGLKIGAKIKGTYKTVSYINYAESIAYAD